MRSAVIFALLVLACGGPSGGGSHPAPAAPEAAAPPAPSAAEPSSPEAANLFPTPYTADQIRGATRPGRTYTWRVEVAGRPPFQKVMAFAAVDAQGADLVSDGTAQRVTWEQLRKHAEFPRAAVQTRDETITVPAGRYDCIVYVVANPTEGQVSQFYFAKSMPGAPVLFFTEKNGARVVTSTLIQYTPGT